jgi:hypothetical protein
MGMFDYVKLKIKCPFCGEEIKNFQTKDTGCNLCEVEPQDIPFEGEFYSDCNSCGLWVQFRRPSFDTTLSKELGSIGRLNQEEILKQIRKLKKEQK